MVINGHYWVPVSLNGHAPEVLEQHIVACSTSFFVVVVNDFHRFQPPNWAFHVTYTKKIISIRFKIN